VRNNVPEDSADQAGGAAAPGAPADGAAKALGAPAEGEYTYSTGWRRFTLVVLPPLIKALMKRDWHGYQHIPRDGGVILAPNHLSYADWGAVALFSHQAGRYPSFMIKSPVFSVKMIGPLLYKVGQFPVHRGDADAALVLKDAEAALRQGACLIVYPEGTASRDPDLWPMAARTGVARLALTTGAPVIPIAHWGAQVILPYGAKKPHLWPRATVQLVAGPPVDLSAFEGAPLNARTLRPATETVMDAITGLLAGLRGEQPPEGRYDPRAGRRLPPAELRAGETGASQDGPTASEDATGAGEEGPGASEDATGAGQDTGGSSGDAATGRADPA
jgi:1-acyl-sn-glycerol-3-phosphate acyltransferase